MHIRKYDSIFGEDIYVLSGRMKNNFFDIEMFGTTHENPSYELYVHPHEYHVFEYVISGKGFIHSKDETYEIKAGDFYYIRRGFVGHYGADKEDPYKKIWVNVSGSMVNNLTDMFGIDEDVYIKQLGEESKNAILRLHALLLNGDLTDGNKKLNECSVIIFELLSLAAGCQIISDSEFSLSFSEYVKRYIYQHIQYDLDLDMIAKRFNMNKSYLIRKFKRETGITPMRYYNICRINAARNLIVFNQKSVKETATILKYSDPAYFSASFKTETGCNPSEYNAAVHAAYLKSLN